MLKLVGGSRRKVDDIGIVLRALLAQHERGELAGTVICAKPINGPEQVTTTGVYAESTERALSAALRTSRRLVEAEEAKELQQHSR